MKAVREIETGMHTYFVIDNNKIKNIVVTNDFKIKQLHVDSRDELNYIINENKQGKA